MLHVRCANAHDMRNVSGYISNVAAYFEYYYKDSWIEDKLFTRILTEIEEIPLIGETNKESLLLYGITVNQISNGSKNLLLCKYLDMINCLSKMGSNCYHILMDLADEKDIYMVATGDCRFSDKDIDNRLISFDDTGVFVDNALDFTKQMADARSRGDFNAKT